VWRAAQAGYDPSNSGMPIARKRPQLAKQHPKHGDFALRIRLRRAEAGQIGTHLRRRKRVSARRERGFLQDSQ